MIILQLRQANQPATVVKVPGDVATVGRTQGSDVVVNQPYVSKRHLRVLKGVVLVDQGSSNGTFVDGQKVSEPLLYTGGEIRLGDGDVFLTVRLDEPESAGDDDRTASDSGEQAPADDGEALRQLELARAENEQLTQQMAEILRRMGEMEALRAAPAVDTGREALLHSELSARGAVLDQLRAELELARRELAGKAELALGLSSLRQELEAVRSEAAHQAERAALELETVRAEAAAQAEQAAQELEAARAEAAAQAERAARELETARAEAAAQGLDSARGTAQALEQAQSEVRELRAALEQAQREAREQAQRAATAPRAEARPAAPPSAAAELFLKLQTENSSLKRRVAELESRAPAQAGHAPAPEAGPAKLLQELVELRAQNAALRAQALGSAARPQPVPAAAPPSTAASSNVRELLARLAQDDVEGQEPLLEGSAEEFLTVEQFRLVRHVERIVTRLAGDFIQLYHANTMLPDVDGNMRELVARVADPSADPDARRELLEYFSQLSRWLVASLGAHRKAAAAFAEKLKSDLSEGALTAQTPIPALKRISGQGEAELWRRVGLYLRELTPDMVEDRLEKLARDAALELFGEHGAQGEASAAQPD